MIVVSDTSVLCYLAQLGKLDLLRHLFGSVVMPAEVLAECTHPRAPEMLRLALHGGLPGFMQVRNVAQRLPETSALDCGESAAISLAWEHRSDALLLIDERSGRAIAKALGLRVRGLLALLADGHRRSSWTLTSVSKRWASSAFVLHLPCCRLFGVNYAYRKPHERPHA